MITDFLKGVWLSIIVMFTVFCVVLFAWILFLIFNLIYSSFGNVGMGIAYLLIIMISGGVINMFVRKRKRR